MDDVPQASLTRQEAAGHAVEMIDGALVQAVLDGAWRRDSDRHGEEHWRCVAGTGLSLADGVPGCDAPVVFLFGLVHDTRRENEHYDPGHGARAASFARELTAAGVLPLDAVRLELLCEALALHSDGLVSDDPTVAACWDADRLHLPRVGIDPNPKLFSTARAREGDRLSEAARLREAPPTWADLVRDVRARPASLPA